MKNPTSVRALFSFPGFVANARLAGVFGDRYARVIRLRRRKKQPFVRTVDSVAAGITTSGCTGSGIWRWQVFGSTWNLNAGGSTARGVVGCT